MKADAVFEGGGMRGIGIVGALCCLESNGYTWEKVAGTSAGAIIASLIAAGYTAKEIKKIMISTDFTRFLDKDRLQIVPVVGRALSLFREKGLYSGDYIETWIGSLLRAKGVSKFKDVMVNGESKLKIIASDITKKNIFILPDDLLKYGINPMEFKIAKAVRMSSSIPFYFKPVKITFRGITSYIVDGCVCCNFPINIFDSEGIPEHPTIGFKFDVPKTSNTARGKTDPLSYLFDIAGTMFDESNSENINEKNMARTILIPTVGIDPTDFNITKKQSHELYKAGFKSSMEFLEHWNFQEYIRKYVTKDASA